jgi:hypothetical protein
MLIKQPSPSIDANITRFRVVSATNQRCPVTYGYAVFRRGALQIHLPATAALRNFMQPSGNEFPDEATNLRVG